MWFASFAINLPILFCFENSSYNRIKAKQGKILGQNISTKGHTSSWVCMCPIACS